MIEVQDISKRFGSIEALRDLSFTARNGAVTGLLGPNGAGKSTCLRILSTVLEADGGSIRIGDIDLCRNPLEVRRIIGVLPHNAGLYPQLTARENIRYFGRLHGLDRSALERRIASLIERLDLAAIADRRARGFSQGERTKVTLARALVHDPQYVLLDEPTNGLDVMAARQLRVWLRELATQGRCVLLSSHVMQEVAALTDELTIIAHGRVVASGSPSELETSFGRSSLEEIFVEAVGGRT
jgi:sodium transport system ATP-binding protein